MVIIGLRDIIIDNPYGISIGGKKLKEKEYNKPIIKSIDKNSRRMVVLLIFLYTIAYSNNPPSLICGSDLSKPIPFSSIYTK